MSFPFSLNISHFTHYRCRTRQQKKILVSSSSFSCKNLNEHVSCRKVSDETSPLSSCLHLLRTNNQYSVPMKWTTNNSSILTTGEATPKTFINQTFPQHHAASHWTREKDDVFPSQLRERDDVIAPHLTLRNRWRRQANRHGSLSTICGESPHLNTPGTTTQNVSRHAQPVGGSFRYSRHLPSTEESGSGFNTSRNLTQDNNIAQ